MKRSVFHNGFIGVAVMSVTLSSCGREPITAWDSPQMLAAKREWDYLLKNPPSIKKRTSKNCELIEAQRAIVDKVLSKDAMHWLAATCDTLPLHELNSNAFEFNVLQHIVVHFVKAGDRESLVSVFAKRYPEYLGPELPTVTYLLCHPHPQFTDPILIFGDAYLRCTEPEVRSRIADAVRIGVRGASHSHGTPGRAFPTAGTAPAARSHFAVFQARRFAVLGARGHLILCGGSGRGDLLGGSTVEVGARAVENPLTETTVIHRNGHQARRLGVLRLESVLGVRHHRSHVGQGFGSVIRSACVSASRSVVA